MTDHATETTPQAKKKAEKKKPDPRTIGYIFPFSKEATPFDYLIDPKTGKTAQNQTAVWSVSMDDLREGIEGCVIPPLFTWENGRWLIDIEDGDWPITKLEVKDAKGEAWDRNVWMVIGEGTPGAFAFRAYLLPTEIANQVNPKHPVMWPKRLKDGKAAKFSGLLNWRWTGVPHDPVANYEKSYELLKYGFIAKATMGVSSGLTTPSSASQVKTTQSTLPTGVRFRCPGCGHWYTETNLTNHIKSGICPGTDEELDMATMCDKECGCTTLDEAARVKPGFPRKPKLPKKKEEEVKPATVSANGKSADKDKQLTTNEVPTPAGGTT